MLRSVLIGVAIVLVLAVGTVLAQAVIESTITGGIKPSGEIVVYGYNNGDYKWVSITVGDVNGNTTQLIPRKVPIGQFRVEEDNPWQLRTPATMETCLWKNAENKKLPNGQYGVVLQDKGPCFNYPPEPTE